MVAGRGTPAFGDRASHSIADPTYHASDIEDGALEVHLPAPSADGTYARDNGVNWVAQLGLLLADLTGWVRGNLIVGGAAVWEALGIGAADTVLKSNATDPAWNFVGHDELTDVAADDHHDPITLAVDAEVLLGLVGQEIQLDSQAANTALMGPAAGAPADPDFRAIALADLPDPAAYNEPTELTIAAGQITVTQTYHTVDTQDDDPTDDLVLINGGNEGELLVLRPASGARTVVLKHGTGNIWLIGGADISLDDLDDHIQFIFNGGDWCSLGDGGGGGAGVGDVVGPAGATDLAIPRYDGVTGKLIKDSLVLISDLGKTTFPDHAQEPPWNITERAAAPGTPAAGDVYLDDGTNTASTNPGWRRWTGAAWEDISAGGGAVDAADVTYTPAVDADWDGGVDPGNANDAFDQLAERTTDIEDLTAGVIGASWNMDGALAVVADVGEQWIMPEACTIVAVIASVKDNGSANSTIVDVHKNGVTLFTDQGDRPEIANDDADNYDVGVPDILAIAQYDELTLDIDAIATDATDLRVTLVIEGIGGGGGGDVVGPAGATDHAIAIYNTGTGKLLQDSLVLISALGKTTLPNDAQEPPLNVTERAAAPGTPAAGDIYLDDGTNTASTDPGWRRYTGAAWEDISAGAGGGGGADILEVQVFL